MTLQWSGRWWLTRGETAATLTVAGRPVPLIFDYDDGTLWCFTLSGDPMIYGYQSDSVVMNGRDRENPVAEGFRPALAILTGGREGFDPSAKERAVLGVIARDLATMSGVSGRKLRHQLRKEFGLEPDGVAYLLERLQPRYVSRARGEELYSLTLPGLYAVRAKETTDVVLWTLSALRLAFDENPDITAFDTTQVMRAPGFSENDTRVWCRTIELAGLGTEPTGMEKGYSFNVPADIEQVVQCKTLPDLLKVSQEGTVRPWPSAPLRPPPTLAESARDQTEQSQRIIAQISAKLRADDEQTRPPGRAGTRAVVSPEVKRMKNYDVALSFAGEDRQHAEALADGVRAAGYEVFYDDYETSNLWGANLPERFHEVYGKASGVVPGSVGI
jgi:hypothetical protein